MIRWFFGLFLLCMPLVVFAANDGVCSLSVPGNAVDEECRLIDVSVLQQSDKLYLQLKGLQAKSKDGRINFIGDEQSWQIKPATIVGSDYVELHGNIALTQRDINLDSDGTHLIELDPLPAGKYVLKLKLEHSLCGICGVPPPNAYANFLFEDIAFEVQGKQLSFLFSSATSTINYSGFWYDPSNPGWGLSIQTELGSHVLAAAWYDYTAEHQPIWRMIESGRWVSTNTYEGTVYQTHTNPYWSHITRKVYGEARFKFSSPTEMTFDIIKDGKTETRNLVKIPLK